MAFTPSMNRKRLFAFLAMAPAALSVGQCDSKGICTVQVPAYPIMIIDIFGERGELRTSCFFPRRAEFARPNGGETKFIGHSLHAELLIQRSVRLLFSISSYQLSTFCFSVASNISPGFGYLPPMDRPAE